ncbi:hypothetical protein [Undibacterium luofuense]|uniref:hypothetical protein n=1 Tax=Undibacterium luofuense TaxID=2828733 RepID=UPI0030EB6593
MNFLVITASDYAVLRIAEADGKRATTGSTCGERQITDLPLQTTIMAIGDARTFCTACDCPQRLRIELKQAGSAGGERAFSGQRT